jgi:hypothetical protein
MAVHCLSLSRRLIPTAATVLLLSTLLAGCGESAAEKDAKQRREDAQAIGKLNEATHRAAEAGIEQGIAEREHREALAKLHADEAAARP